MFEWEIIHPVNKLIGLYDLQTNNFQYHLFEDVSQYNIELEK